MQRDSGLANQLRDHWVASMLASISIRPAVLGGLACLALIAGCAAPVIRSQRLLVDPTDHAMHSSNQHVSPHDCHSCRGRQRLRDLAPYVAGPFLHGQPGPYAAEQATIQPAPAKFHPVPTRPVFATRDSYSPPEPIGVHLVPVPEHAPFPNSHLPAMIFPDIGLPPVVEDVPWPPTSSPDETMPLPPPEDA